MLTPPNPLLSDPFLARRVGFFVVFSLGGAWGLVELNTNLLIAASRALAGFSKASPPACFSLSHSTLRSSSAESARLAPGRALRIPLPASPAAGLNLLA